MEALTDKVYKEVKNKLLRVPGVIAIARTDKEIIVYAADDTVKQIIQPYIAGLPVKIYIVRGFIAHASQA